MPAPPFVLARANPHHDANRRNARSGCKRGPRASDFRASGRVGKAGGAELASDARIDSVLMSDDSNPKKVDGFLGWWTTRGKRAFAGWGRMHRTTFSAYICGLGITLAGCGDDDGGGGGGGDNGATSVAASSGVVTSDEAGGSGQDDSGTGVGSNTGGSTTTTPTNPVDTDGCASVPTFERDIVPIIEQSCGADNGTCHSRSAYGAQASMDCRGWLSLENAPLGAEFYDGPDAGEPTGCPDLGLFERLTELDAWNCEDYDPRRKYVVPCDPEGSYLFNKIAGAPLCNIDKEGETNVPSWPMPPPPEEQKSPFSISQGEIDTIYTWILNGAPRDGQECDALCEGGSDDSTGEGETTDTGIGASPQVQINHPGDGEVRQVNVNIPLIGVADDAEDGPLSGAALVWNSDLEGDVATGGKAGWIPTSLGVHILVLTATDLDGNTGMDAIQIEVVP